ncbi:hypothetical protein [Alloacidobacterium sp.]|uniref:lipopolysaccharide biosynthesis protein n=1 Tax=Alloacidobacterium sp. TaxID=2951999 RepID=UPI002D6E0E19|nr:hypothetical protein [Alloacidobacterium sp.]HYK34336.1 hypothetical protein [Alloacidobacterium sp.]
MSLRRILHLVLTSFIGQGVSVITQLLIPPFFLHFYGNGVEVYGEWIALSASISYLGTLNYGIQTYANNETTILYNRGEVEASKAVQSSALRLMLSLIALFMTVGSAVFLMPVAEWLNLKHVSSRDASLTIYLLIVQMAVYMLFALLASSYMVVGKLPRGAHIGNLQRLCMVLALSIAIWMRASFPVLALVQLVTLTLFLLLLTIDLYRTAPILVPSLRYGSWKQVLAIVKPSGHFMLIAFASFLTWQGPVLLIQKVLGSGTVGVFALVRVVFQMSRQILSVASMAVGQDITLLVGQRNWIQLRRLYELSERVVLFLIPVVSIGSLMMCPFLFTVWLHKRTLYEPTLCLLMAITSAVLGIKEHKTQFQSSSNEHEELSIIAVTGYSVMLLASIFTMKAFGLVGFMCTWLAWEIIQTGLILRLNRRLFPAGLHVSMMPIARLALFLFVAFGLVVWPSYREVHWPLSTVVGISVLVTAVMGTVAYFSFDLSEVRSVVESKVRRKLVPNP